jgi:hypothetical protein
MAGTSGDDSMADEQKNAGPDSGPSDTSFAVSRREQRLPVPAVYHRYINLNVKINDVFVPVILQNFSGSGVLFESQEPFAIESRADCVISLPQSLSKEIAFDIRVKHCRKKKDTFFIGATIETVADATWFNVFREVHDFIMERQGDVY